MTDNKDNLPLTTRSAPLAKPPTPSISSASGPTGTPPLSPQKTNKIVKSSKPHSKTALGRLTYELGDNPSIYHANLTVGMSSTDDDDRWVAVESHKLKRQIVTKWLESSETQPIKHLISTDIKTEFKTDEPRKPKMNVTGSSKVDLESEKTFCRIFVPVLDQAHSGFIKRTLQDAPTIFFGLNSRSQNSDGTITSRNARCLVQEGGYPAAKTRQIPSLLRDSPRTFQDPPAKTKYSVDARLHECSSDSKKKKMGSSFALYTRIQPSIDVPAKKLHLDFNLVPCAETKPVYDVLSDLVGIEKPSLELISQNIKAIARSLRGMYVRCIYTPSGNTEKGFAKERILAKNQMHIYHRFRLNDIAMLSENDSFTIDITKTETLNIPTRQYFKDGKWILISDMDIDPIVVNSYPCR
mgnify:CR=1 FL=1